jgi:translation initiation factor IF-2
LAVRIYSLAKELKIDSKVLVDDCTRAGIPGKGSALASLTDDEVVRLKEYLSGGGRGGAGPAARGPKTMAAPSGATALAEPDVVRREDYIAPGGKSVGKPPVLDSRSEKPQPIEARKKPSPGGEGPKPAPKGPTAIKLAPLPPSSMVLPPKSAAEEPAPQKPDLRLPADAIRASKAGSKPLQEHLRKHEQKRKTDSAVKPRERCGSAPPMPVPPPLGEAGSRERRRGGKPAVAKAGQGGDVFDSSLGGREARQLARKRSAPTRKPGGEDDEPAVRGRRGMTRLKRSGTASTAAPRKGKVTLQLPASVRSFSEAVGVSAAQVLRKLLDLGINVANINAILETETVELLAVELGAEIELKQAFNLEDQILSTIDRYEDAPEQLRPRPPVITFLGHVDHGKTSLLDKIIGIDVASGESGGITQHIRAYEIERNGRQIAFVDTPGHEAFTEMRARGANVTDIAVLVVAADDGVMPQTEEAISHGRAAGVPIVVALNKIDLPGVNIERIYQQLATSGLLPTDWGGDVEVVKTSALTGAGIEDLLETLFTIAELNDLRANPSRPAVGTCIEAEVHEGRGVVAKLLVQKGTLKIGDAIICGTATGHVKAMYDTLDRNRRFAEAGPSTPVNMTGLDVAPQAGERFYVLDDIAQARQIAAKRQEQNRQQTLGSAPTHVTLENLFDRLGKQEVQTLNMILRADTQGSIEGIQKELTKLEHPEVKIKVLQATVGGVSEADVHLADASDAVIIGFRVVPDEGARTLAERKGVQIRRYEIIYKVTEDLRAALEGMLEPEKREAELGRALVQRTFTISRIGTIAGCRVLSGNVQRNARMRIIRDNRVIGDYALDSLKREKDDAREVREGMECGIKLAGFNDVKEGDVLEAYRIEEVARTF